MSKNMKKTITWPYTPSHPFAIGLVEKMKEQGIDSYYVLSRETGIPLTTCREIFGDEYSGPNWKTVETLAEYFGQSCGNFARSLEEKFIKKRNKKT